MPKSTHRPPNPAYAMSKRYFRLLDRRVAAGRRYAELVSHQLARVEAAAALVADLEAQLESNCLYNDEDREAVARAQAARFHDPGSTCPDDEVDDPCQLCARMRRMGEGRSA